jgi:hypothetical protein
MSDTRDEDTLQKERRRRQAEELIADALRERERFRMQKALKEAAQAKDEAPVRGRDGEE